MDDRILAQLGIITNEEAQLISGRSSIDRSIYMNDGSRDVITGKKLLDQGKLITVRPHTRFVHFPVHTHDYVEIVYMCRGCTEHLINDTPITLREGELLLLGQNTRQEILPAGEDDIAVNFIVQPEFFSGTLDFLGSEDTPLREFIVRCLCGENPSGYLHFKVADVKPVQNLVENLLWTLISDTPNRRSINQLTMGLLFVQLLNHTDKLTVGNKEQDTIVWVLRYIEDHYADGSLTEIADILHYDVTWLSREIKRRTGKTYTELLQEKRLSQAAWLLKNTRQKVADIGISVGYENLSYFHRIFAQHFGISPKAYRDCK
jgi:AraC-like DNA-binding protein